MQKSTRQSPHREGHARTRQSRVARRVAAVAGAAGAAIAGEAEAVGISYVPTAGVATAQNIPGFSFTAPSTVTSGTLRPPSTGSFGWDVDGDGSNDFSLVNFSGLAGVFNALATAFPSNPNALLGPGVYGLLNLVGNAAVGPAQAWTAGVPYKNMTYQGVANNQADFTTNTPGYFGFRFAFNNNPTNYYYGWGGLTIDLTAAGRGFKVTEAFYQSTPNTTINVGAVPAPVPEPSTMVLLAAGAAGVTAWRSRKRKQPAAE